jgi:hypothetical protein
VQKNFLTLPVSQTTTREFISNTSVKNVKKKYFNIRFDLSCDQGCLFYEHRVVIPEELKNEIFKKLHEEHIEVVLNTVSSKEIAKDYVHAKFKAEIEEIRISYLQNGPRPRQRDLRVFLAEEKRDIRRPSSPPINPKHSKLTIKTFSNVSSENEFESELESRALALVEITAGFSGHCMECEKKNPSLTHVKITTFCPACRPITWSCLTCFDDTHGLWKRADFF